MTDRTAQQDWARVSEWMKKGAGKFPVDDGATEAVSKKTRTSLPTEAAMPMTTPAPENPQPTSRSAAPHPHQRVTAPTWDEITRNAAKARVPTNSEPSGEGQKKVSSDKPGPFQEVAMATADALIARKLVDAVMGKPAAPSVAKSPTGAISTVSGKPESPKRFAKLRCFAGILAKALRWVWRLRFPAGKVCLLVGDPDEGKSLITIDMTARITTGGPFPDGAPCERGSVIILSAEDDPEDTIRPRLDAAGADVSRVHLLSAVRIVQKDGAEGERGFSLESDIEALEDAIKQHPDTRMIVIDPISAYLGGTDSHNNAAVRGLLSPLSDLAARTGVLILGVTHLRKTGGQAIHRSIESIAFTAAGRATWGVAKDPEDTNKRVMVRIKGNLGRDPGGLSYRIEETPSGIPRIAWEPGAVNLRADDVLGGLDSREERSERHEAAEWLREFLADGPQPAREVQKHAADAGFSWITIRRAKATLSVCSQQTGLHGGWRWSLRQPDQASDPTGAEPPSSTDAHPRDIQVSTCGAGIEKKGDTAQQPATDAHPTHPEHLSTCEEGRPTPAPAQSRGAGEPVEVGKPDTPNPAKVKTEWRY